MSLTPSRSLEHVASRLVLFGGLPAVATAIWLLWTGDHGVEVRWTLSVLLPSIWLGSAIVARQRLTRPMQLLVNLLGALREGDYSLRGAAARTGDLLGDVMLEVNALGETLHRQRLSAVEATALLSSVLGEVDVALFAFDDTNRLRLVNRAGANLLDRPMDDLIGRRASEVGLADYISGPAPRTFDRVFPGGRGRWELRRSDFRQDGRPHRLVVLADLSRALREEELQAWQRLIRVLSHEINNSLTPIQSITRSVRRIIERDYAGGERSDEVQEGLRVVATRAESLGRLMSEYARLARLPKPVLQSVRIDELVRGVAGLEPRVTVRIMPRSVSFEDATLMADPAQLEQLLINLVRNAADASLETGGEVAIGWRVDGDTVQLMVEDDGHGIADPANLFVPFYTTKPHGTGIGLALSRQIAEAHGGAVTLENRENGKGCRATLSLPIDMTASSRNGERS